MALETGEELHVELPAEKPKARAAAAGVGFAGAAGASLRAWALLPDGMDMEKYVADIEKSLLLDRPDPIERRADPRRRFAEDFLPFVPAFDEEVRISSSQPSAFSRQ